MFESLINFIYERRLQRKIGTIKYPVKNINGKNRYGYNDVYEIFLLVQTMIKMDDDRNYAYVGDLFIGNRYQDYYIGVSIIRKIEEYQLPALIILPDRSDTETIEIRFEYF